MKAFMTIIILLVNTVLFAKYEYSEVLFLPWGDNDLNVGFIKTPEGQFGPMSFAVKNDTILILDSQHGELKNIFNNSITAIIKLPPENAEDFIWKSANHYYLLSDNTVLNYIDNKLEKKYKPEFVNKSVSSIFEKENGEIFIKFNDGKFINPFTLNKPRKNHADGLIKINKINWQTFQINSDSKRLFTINAVDNKFGSARFLRHTPNGDLFIYLETIVQEIPLIVEREIRLYSSTGSLETQFLIPVHSYTYIFREFFVDKAGNLFHMISSQDGIHIIGWFKAEKNIQTKLIYTYPQKFLY